MRLIRKAFIKRSRVTRSSADSKQFPTVQSEYNGKVRMVEVVFPYGLSGWIPVNALGHQFNMNGDEGDQAAIFNVPTERFKLAAEGEVAIGNPKSKSVVYFRENGDVETVVKNDVNETIDGEMNLIVEDGLNITADTAIDGTLNVTDGVKFDSTLEVAGKLGVSGTFTTTDGKTVQVKNGIIWSIV